MVTGVMRWVAGIESFELGSDVELVVRCELDGVMKLQGPGPAAFHQGSQ